MFALVNLEICLITTNTKNQLSATFREWMHLSPKWYQHFADGGLVLWGLKEKGHSCNTKLLLLSWNLAVCSCVTGGGGGGQGTECPPPPRLLTGKFLLTYREKRGKKKMEKGKNVEENKENCKREASTTRCTR